MRTVILALVVAGCAATSPPLKQGWRYCPDYEQGSREHPFFWPCDQVQDTRWHWWRT